MENNSGSMICQTRAWILTQSPSDTGNITFQRLRFDINTMEPIESNSRANEGGVFPVSGQQEGFPFVRQYNSDTAHLLGASFDQYFQVLL